MNKKMIAIMALGAATLTVAGCYEKSPVAEEGSEVSVQYIGRLAGDENTTKEDIIKNCKKFEVFDTSYIDVAKACGSTTTETGSKALTFEIGKGKLIPGFEEAVKGHKKGEKISVKILAKDAYGEWSKEKIQSVSLKILPPKVIDSKGTKGKYVVGDKIQGIFPITAISGDNVSVDTNHPLAGKDLFFDIEIVDVKKVEDEHDHEAHDHDHDHGEEGSMKKDEMKKDEMKKDEMKKDEMKKDEMKKDEMKKDEMKKDETK